MIKLADVAVVGREMKNTEDRLCDQLLEIGERLDDLEFEKVLLERRLDYIKSKYGKWQSILSGIKDPMPELQPVSRDDIEGLRKKQGMWLSAAA